MHAALAQQPARPASPQAQGRRHWPWQILSGTGLKWLAIVTMAIDHIGAILVWNAYLQMRYTDPLGAGDLYDVYYLLRQIGRIAFPLFCFLLVEGFTHTRSRSKYFRRLMAFALATEIIYDFALYDSPLEFAEHQNVMFTLSLGFLALWGADGVSRGLRLPGWAGLLVTVAFVAAFAGLAEVFEVSYRAFGVVLIGALYIARRYRLLQFVLGGLAVGWYCWDHDSMLEMYSLIGLGAILLYNGKRGRGMKYFFYFFYPVHLLVLGLLRVWMFGA